jgi:hypothetical protein
MDGKGNIRPCGPVLVVVPKLAATPRPARGTSRGRPSRMSGGRFRPASHCCSNSAGVRYLRRKNEGKTGVTVHPSMTGPRQNSWVSLRVPLLCSAVFPERFSGSWCSGIQRSEPRGRFCPLEAQKWLRKARLSPQRLPTNSGEEASPEGRTVTYIIQESGAVQLGGPGFGQEIRKEPVQRLPLT